MELVATSAAQSAMGLLLGKLGGLIAGKYALLGGVRDDIQELKDEVESMAACFRDVAGMGDDDGQKEQMRTWMKQVREISYDAEDCIDIFLHHLSKHSGDSRGLARHAYKILDFLRTLKVRLKLATEIQSLKFRAQKVSERRLRYKLDALDMPDNMASSSNYMSTWIAGCLHSTEPSQCWLGWLKTNKNSLTY